MENILSPVLTVWHDIKGVTCICLEKPGEEQTLRINDSMAIKSYMAWAR